MSVVQARCTNCGTILNVDTTMDASICPHCGCAFIVQKAISNFNQTNSISSNSVKYYGNNSYNPHDFIVRAGVLEKYNGAAIDVVIPDNVTIIGQSAFQGCMGLRSVIIPNSVSKIMDGAFKCCNSLIHVTISCSVTEISMRLFENCISLESIIIPEGVMEIGYSAFKDCVHLKNITLPNSVTKIRVSAFENCSNLTNITIPKSVTEIGPSAFKDCKNLTNITLPNRISQIYKGTFANCVKLKGITIPSSVTEIVGVDYYGGEGAFQGCSGLTNVSLPNGIKKIGSYAFYGCTNLESIIIPETVVSIEECAFTDCVGLTSVTIPDSVSNLAKEAFFRCSNLRNVINGKRFSPDCFRLSPYAESGLKGCYIATAVYHSYDCPPVWTLRRFRDMVIARTWYGCAFIKFYYTVSPILVKQFGKKQWFQNIFHKVLDSMVHWLQSKGIEDTPYEDIDW